MAMNEILLLVLGVAVGAQLANALHAYWAWRDIRRGQEAAFRLARLRAADRYRDSLRLYQLLHRGPA